MKLWDEIVRWNINLPDETVQQLKHTVNNVIERFVENKIQYKIPSVVFTAKKQWLKPQNRSNFVEKH